MSRSQSELQLTSAEKSLILSTFPKGLVVFDLETSGLSPLVNKIIEIAAIKVDEQGVESQFHQLVNPLVELTKENSAIHGLTNEDLIKMPGLRHPLKEFFQFIGESNVWAHNAIFDAGFIIRGAHELNLSLPTNRIYDTCRLIKVFYKDKKDRPENFKLGTLAEYFNFQFKSHQAMNDTMVCLKILCAVINIAPREEFKTCHEKAYVFSFRDFKSANLNHFPSHLREMIPMVEKRLPLMIRYDGGTAKGEWRKVSPLAFLPMPKGPVLLGRCLDTHLTKSYVLKLIREFRLMDSVVSKPTEDIGLELNDV